MGGRVVAITLLQFKNRRHPQAPARPYLIQATCMFPLLKSGAGSMEDYLPLIFSKCQTSRKMRMLIHKTNKTTITIIDLGSKCFQTLTLISMMGGSMPETRPSFSIHPIYKTNLSSNLCSNDKAWVLMGRQLARRDLALLLQAQH